MGKYGLKIGSYQAAVLYEYQLGVRDHVDKVDAMLTKSLFFDFMEEIGMKSIRDRETRDVIVVRFDFGTVSYEGQVKRLKNQRKQIEYIEDDEKRRKKLAHLEEIEAQTLKNKDIYQKNTVQELRKILYRDGIDVTYVSRYKNGDIKKKETIHYKMAYRTAGKAKIGECCFICDRLWDKAIDFLHMGIKLPEHNAPIVELQAYSSLITSTIVGKVRIEPDEILVLKDVDSFFETNVACIETDVDKHCYVEHRSNYKLKNTLFDGQALIDESIFPSWGDGYVLLRQHHFKAAAFHTKIQTFFKDWFGENYDSAELEDMFGRKVLAKNVKLITTDNALKFLKFDVPYENWAEWVRKNDSLFGIVKTAHESKLGLVQQQSYQMINALDIDTMSNVVKYSVDYINTLKTNDAAFLNYLQHNATFSNDFEVLLALVEQDNSFIRSEYFTQRRREIIRSYINRFKNGKVLNNGDNLVIVGSPYAMLLHSVGEDALSDDTFSQEEVATQCYTERFEDGEFLAEFRSPFNSRNNLGYLHNHYDERFKRYFNLGRQIIAINMIGTSFQDKNNGSDQDSDSIYTTNQSSIVEHARYCTQNYPTIVNNIPKEKNHYDNCAEDQAIVDSKIAAANMGIGESSNLAQLCLTYTYSYPDQKKYLDYTCILSVLAQVCIDNAKRTFDIDLNTEIKRIKKDMNVQENGFPAFWFILKRKNKFNKKKERQETSPLKILENPKCNKDLVCPMNYLFDLRLDRMPRHEVIPNSEFFVKYDLDISRRKSKKVETLIERYSQELYSYFTSNDEGYEILQIDFEILIEEIKSIYISGTYTGLMSWLIDRALMITPQMKSNKKIIDSNLYRNRSLLFKTLYSINPSAFLSVFAKKCNTENNCITLNP